MSGLAFLRPLRIPALSLVLGAVGAVGILLFVGDIVYAFYVFSSSPTAPNEATGQVHSFNQKGTIYFIRAGELFVLSLVGWFWGVGVTGLILRGLIFGNEWTAPAPTKFQNSLRDTLVIGLYVVAAAGVIHLLAFLGNQR